MTRAGREPAEDLKRRLVAACQEVGLSVTSANMHLGPDGASRVVLVSASPAGWWHASPMLSVTGIIPVTGRWPESVDIRCCASDTDPLPMNSPWMKGRDQVPMHALLEELRQTIAEREQVIAAMKSGLPGPYRFERTVWEPVDLLGPAGLF